MSLYSQYETNKQSEVSGIWAEIVKNENGTMAKFKLARMAKANKKYTKALERATRPHRRAIELETMDNELADKIFMEVFVDTVLLDWQNVYDRDGEVIEFTKANAIKLFEDLPELYDDLQERAKKASSFREETLDAEAGN